MQIARIMRWFLILVVAGCLAGCGGSGPSAAEVRCQNDRREANEAQQALREDRSEAAATGSLEQANIDARHGLEAISAQAKDCR